MVDNLSAVYHKFRAANLLVLDSVMNCYVVEAGLFHVKCKVNRMRGIGFLVINVRIRKSRIYFTFPNLVIFNVCTGRTIECIQPDYIFTCELFGKSCGEVEYIVHSIAIVIEGGSNSELFEFIVAVDTLAIFNSVLMVIIYIPTLKANAPLLVKAVAIVVFVALNSFQNHLDCGNSYLTVCCCGGVANAKGDRVSVNHNNCCTGFNVDTVQGEHAGVSRFISNLNRDDVFTIQCSNSQFRIFTLIESPTVAAGIVLTGVKTVAAGGSTGSRNDDTVTQIEGLVVGAGYPTVCACNFFNGGRNYALIGNIGNVRLNGRLGSRNFGVFL